MSFMLRNMPKKRGIQLDCILQYNFKSNVCSLQRTWVAVMGMDTFCSGYEYKTVEESPRFE